MFRPVWLLHSLERIHDIHHALLGVRDEEHIHALGVSVILPVCIALEIPPVSNQFSNQPRVLFGSSVCFEEEMPTLTCLAYRETRIWGDA